MVDVQYYQEIIMLKQVLESVSSMLEASLKDTPEIPKGDLGITLTYVKCAKDLLDKTISTLESPATEIVASQPSPRRVLAREEKYFIDVELGHLKSIKKESGAELDEEAMVEVNGMAYPYKDVKGQPFQTGRVL